MLLLGHVGYTVGGGWAAQRLGLRNRVDFRLLAFMAILPDIIDRSLFLLIPEASSGHLIAHTLLFQLLLLAVLVAIRREFWIYGVASMLHLVLDVEGLAAEQTFWPLLGSDPAHIGIMDADVLTAGQSYLDRVWDRLGAESDNYFNAGARALLLDLGGLAILVVFAVTNRLYQGKRLLSFARDGRSPPGRC